MSYNTRGMGSTATDIAAIAAAASAAAASLIGSATGGSTASTLDPTTGLPYGTINPATGMPYGAIDPATGLPYGTAAETSYVPVIVGGLVLAGVVGFLVMRKRSTPNRRRRMHANGRVRKTRDVYEVRGNYGHGHGFEMVTTETEKKEARDRLREYRENEPGVPFKIVKVRERI